jgi:hypothetical protein
MLEYNIKERTDMATFDEIRAKLIDNKDRVLESQKKKVELQKSQVIPLKRWYYFGLFMKDVTKDNRLTFEQEFKDDYPKSLCLLHASRKNETKELQAMLTDLYNFEGVRVKRIKTNSEYGRYNIITDDPSEATLIKLAFGEEIIVQLEIPEEIEFLITEHRKIKETETAFKALGSKITQYNQDWYVQFVIQRYYRIKWLIATSKYIVFKSDQDIHHFYDKLENKIGEYIEHKDQVSRLLTNFGKSLLPGEL